MNRSKATALPPYLIYRDLEPGENEFINAISELCEAYCKARGFESEMCGDATTVSDPRYGTHVLLIGWPCGSDMRYWRDLLREARDLLRDEFKIYVSIAHMAKDDIEDERAPRCPRDFRRWLTNGKGKAVLRDILKRRRPLPQA